MIKSFCKNSISGIFVFISIACFPQKHDRIWLFADSAGIDFNDLTNPVTISSNIANPCGVSFTSIADNSGQLLFYAAGVELTFYSMRAFDKNGNVMQNGDSLRGYPWVGQGSMIIPIPADSNRYYLFIGNRTGSMGNNMYYNIIDMSLNNGLGAVVSKNKAPAAAGDLDLQQDAVLVAIDGQLDHSLGHAAGGQRPGARGAGSVPARAADAGCRVAGLPGNPGRASRHRGGKLRPVCRFAAL